MPLVYAAYELQRSLMAPLRAWAATGVSIAEASAEITGKDAQNPVLRHFHAACHLLAETRISHDRPDFKLHAIEIDGRRVAIDQETVTGTPFCGLIRFRQQNAPPQPRILVAAPLSGHFATLLGDTIASLVRDHEVYLTDWTNMRDVPMQAGRFGLDDYVEHLIRFLDWLGPDQHLLAVCQPCVPALAAVAVMAEQRHRALPRSMTLMAGPIDTRINPTKVNNLAMDKPIAWFRANLVTTVPWPHAGAGRSVYPGFLQLTAFMAMQPQRHVRAHCDLYDHLANGRHAEAATIAAFYHEYFSVLDLSAEFYLETVELIFQKAQLATGELRYRGVPVRPGLIRNTALLTIEGERDDICAPGQTLAAQDLCSGLRPHMRRHHLQPGVGHYGVFSGRRWASQVYPIVQNFILLMSDRVPKAPRRRLDSAVAV